jgi:heparanase 1
MILLFFLFLAVARSEITTIDWTAEPSEASAKTTRKLVSFNFDWHPPDEGPTWGQNASIVSLDLQNPRLKKLTAAMSPAYLRIGGSEADDAVFDFDNACKNTRGGSGIPDPAYCMTTSRWDEVLGFAKETGVDVAFTVNVMYGRNCTVRCKKQPCAGGNTGYGTCSPWDPSNALALLKYTAQKGLHIGGFEVGNEKEHVLTPADYASCMQIMRKAIDSLWPDATSRPLLIGPDENPRADWLHEMLVQGGDVADVVTYHLYAGYGLDPSLSKELVDPGFLDFTRLIGGNIQRVVQAAAPHAQLWVGETAAAWHSGEAGITDAFESGFWFVDQLGTLASMSHAAMCRQCFVGGNYSMIGVNDGFVPRPDYYTGLLFKRLMGEVVLTSYQSEPAVAPYVPSIRGYLHCTPEQPTGVTFAYVNVDADRSFGISLKGLNTDGTHMNTTARVEYVLSSGGMGPPGPHQSLLSSLHIKLNGKLLALGADDAIPDMTGEHAEGGTFVAPPRTYGFIVFPNANARACLAGRDEHIR